MIPFDVHIPQHPDIFVIQDGAWHENRFRIARPLWVESFGHSRFTSNGRSCTTLDVLLLTWTTCRTISRSVGDLRRCDVYVTSANGFPAVTSITSKWPRYYHVMCLVGCLNFAIFDLEHNLYCINRALPSRTRTSDLINVITIIVANNYLSQIKYCHYFLARRRIPEQSHSTMMSVGVTAKAFIKLELRDHKPVVKRVAHGRYIVKKCTKIAFL